MKKIAIISGTFDPITTGHFDLIKKASELFETVYVVVCDNAEKKNMFDVTKRLEAVNASIKQFSNVSTDTLGNMTIADYTKAKDGVIIRGVRNGTDADYEISLAQINKAIAGVDTIILPTSSDLSYVSSTFVRELIKHKKPYDEYVPQGAVDILK